jgi:N-succinyldiaminopimelate aminotransferase
MNDSLMNPRLARLHPYPFERLRALLAGRNPPPPRAHLDVDRRTASTPPLAIRSMR